MILKLIYVYVMLLNYVNTIGIKIIFYISRLRFKYIEGLFANLCPTMLLLCKILCIENIYRN
jgi:hypothetical protein